MAYALYISHPQVVIDPSVLVPDWSLSERGRERAAGFTTATMVKGLKRLVCSHEVKAQETAAILGAALGIAVEERDGFEEIDRSVPGYRLCAGGPVRGNRQSLLCAAGTVG